jgi:peptidoglycan/LPS O-acetylase OafA/YrhL
MLKIHEVERREAVNRRIEKPQPSAGRIPALDGLRGLAILLVLLWHSVFTFKLEQPWLQRLVNLGGLSWSGVDLFFVLSGFLIGGILLDARESPRYYQTFYIRRAYRILPLYFLVLIPCWSLLLATQAGWIPSIWAFVFQGPVPTWMFFTLTQNVGMAFFGVMSGEALSITWSLAVEEQFYLALPLMIREVARKYHFHLALGAILAAPLLRLALIRFYSDGVFCNYFLTPCRADALGWGVLCALLARNRRAWEFLNGRRRLLYYALAVLGALLLVLTIYLETIAEGTYSPLTTSYHGLEYSLVALFCATLLLIAVTGEDAFVKTLLCNRLMIGLGTIAYGTYLIHFILIVVIHILIEILHIERSATVLRGTPLLAIAIAIVLASISWRFFESPLVRRGHSYRY